MATPIQPRAVLGPLLAAALCAGALSSEASTGDTAQQESAEEKSLEAVYAAMRAGLDAFRAERFEEAREHFLEAWELRPLLPVAASLGETEMHLGRHDEAVHFWRYVLAHSEEEADRDLASAQLDDCLRRVGIILLHSNVTGATVRVAGKTLPTTELGDELLVTPGTHELTVEHGDYQPYRKTFAVAAGEVLRLDVALAPRPNQLPSEAPPPPKEAESSWRVPVIVGGAILTVAAATTGAWFRLATASHEREAHVHWRAVREDADPTWWEARAACLPEAPGRPAACDALAGSLSAAGRAHRRSNIAFLTAGVLGTATLATWLLWPVSKESKEGSSGKRPSVAVAPWGDLTSPGVVLVGEF